MGKKTKKEDINSPESNEEESQEEQEEKNSQKNEAPSLLMAKEIE